MRSRNKLTRFLALFLALLTVVSYPLSARADGGFYEEGDADYDTGGGTSTDKSGEFNLSYTNDVTKQIVGYRITGIKANGERQADNSTDVYIKDAQYIKDLGQSNFKSKFQGSDIYVSMNQYCKREFYQAEASNSALADGTITSKSNYVYEWNYSLTGNIPTTEAAFESWQDKTTNANQVAKWAGYSSKSAMKNGDKIIVEPIYIVNKLQSKTCFLTVSEIANFGQSWYGGSSNGWSNTGASGNGAGTFGFISSYTNRKWPNAFYTKDGMGLWEGATAISESTTKRETFNNLLLKGYGVIILYDEPTLPDLYVESIKFYTTDGQEQIRTALPLNKDIYVVATFRATTNEAIKANFFGGNLSGDRTGRNLNVSTEMKVATGYIGMSTTFGVRYGIYDNVTMTSYPSSTSRTRHEQTMYDGGTYKVRIGTLKSSDAAAFGYYHAAIYKNDKTAATASDETNITNNYMRIAYEFSSTLTRDLELSNIVLKLNGATLSGDALKSIPFGSTIEVYHTYKSNSASDGSKITEPYCVTLSGASSDPKGMVTCPINGSFVHETSPYYSTKKVATFKAMSLIDTTRYGGIYLKSDYNYDAAEETNADNNKKYVTWKAKCDIQVYQIILKDANGNVLGTYTRGGTNPVPTLKPGQKVYVYYKYKNTSAGDIVANGHRSKSATSGNLTVSEVTIPSNGTIIKYSHSFTVGSEQSGKVSGAVYVDKDEYGITSTSVTYTGCETNSNNNTLEMTYDVEDPIDLEITKIQYVYTDKDGEKQTLTVNRGGTNIPEIPLGATVAVWYTYKNNSDEAVKIDGYYSYNKTGSPGTLISDTRTDYNANGITINAGKTKRVCSGSFTASKLGEAYYYGAVFQDGKTSATGEKNTTNNEMTAKYKVRGYDVAITDIYFVGEDGTEYSKGANRDTMEYGETYDIYYTIQNNSTEPVHVNLYDSIDPNEEGALCVTPVSYYRDGGIYLEAGDSTSICVGELTPANQVIGENCVDGSVFIGSNTSTNFTYGDYTGSEAISVNNMREETVVLKFDVAITDIYHTLSGETARLDDFVPAKRPVDIHYVVKNNSNAPVKVNVYYESEYDPDNLIKVSDHGAYVVIELGAGEEADIIVNTAWYDTDKDGYTFWGHVYRDNQTPRRDPYEKTFENNVLEESVHVIEVPYLEAIKPNAKYRVGTDVITSFYLHNPTDVNYTGLNGNGLKVAFTVKDVRGNVLYTATQDAVVVPANCEGEEFPTIYQPGENGGAQLVFFKWSMPEEYEYSYVVVNAELYVPDLDLVTTSLSNRRYVCSNEELNTPDTQYEAEPPTNWQTLVNASAPFNSASVGKSWYVYTYTFGRFARNSYFCALTAGDTWITPMSVTTRYDGSQYYMRSGYGVRLYSVGYSINKYATPEMYTDMQYAYATWQEFGYSTEEGCITTLEKVGSLWQLPEFLHYDKRVHFTPIWYPNRDYSAYVCYSDLWTPMGMITVATETNEIIVDQDMYDDWYISH